MKKVIVTLRDAPNSTVEVPESFPRRKRGKKKEKARKIERSVFGAIRLFPGIPKAISSDELEYVRAHRPDVFGRLERRPYVESKRVDYRGGTEGEIESLAEAEGLGHLELPRQIDRLVERKKLETPKPTDSSVTKLDGPKKNGKSGDGGKTATRKPK